MGDPALILAHYTVVSALGRGLEAQAAGLQAGGSYLSPHVLAEGQRVEVGRVEGVEEFVLPAELARYDCRNNRLAALALETDSFAEAVRERVRSLGASRVGLVVGTSTSGIAKTEEAYREAGFRSRGALLPDFPYRETHNVFSSADFTRRYLGLEGPAFVISTACSSSAKAFGTAARLIRSGTCDAVVVGGVDSLCDTTLYGFQSLGLLSQHRPRPFSADRDGIAIGEAAGFALVLAADKRTQDHGLYLAGIGDSADAFHMTAPHPQGLGAEEAMSGALRSAGWRSADVDYIHLHGTGTLHNDAAEALAIFHLGCENTPVSSTKGATGHTLGAAGMCAAVFAGIAMSEGFIPGTTNTVARDPALRCHLIVAPRPALPRRALINTFGFGGSNCALALEWRP